MKWQEIRNKYPNKWLLVEASKAHSENSRRIVDDLEMIEEFSESISAMKRYQELHRQNPTREFYVVHTNKEELYIKERKWIAVRTGQAA